MIGMRVGVKNRVEVADLLPDCLLPKIGSRINQNCVTGVLNQYRWPGATVARITRAANGAVAADGGHAHGRPAAEDGQPCLHFAAGTCCAPLAIAFVTSTYAMRSS